MRTFIDNLSISNFMLLTIGVLALSCSVGFYLSFKFASSGLLESVLNNAWIAQTSLIQCGLT